MTDDPRPEVVVTWLRTADADHDALVRLAAEVAGPSAAGVSVVRACHACASDQHGQPRVVLAAAEGPEVHLSLSRSGSHTVVAVTRAGPVGVDVEVGRSPGLTSWVRTESVLKATGRGLDVDPDQITVTPPDEQPAVLRWPRSLGPEQPVWMVDLDAPDELVAALAVLTDVPPRVVTRPAAPAG